MKRIVKQIFRKFGLQITRSHSVSYQEKIITLESENGHKGNVLVSFIIKPFISSGGEPDISQDINWGCYQIVKTFLDLGYSVDVIHYQNKTFIPKKNYTFFLDLYTNMERIAPLLNKNCIKILHPRWAHWLYNNYSSYKRCLELQKRKGIVITRLRLLQPNLSTEHADCLIVLGNEFALSTYSYADKVIYRVPYAISLSLSWPEKKNFDVCRKNFLFFSGGGFVHKGLDLVLDAFVSMPDYNLYICGPLEKENEFVNIYYRELYELPNICTLGWVDINSPDFSKITNNCIAHIHPSCSEMGGGSILNCMQAGLIPIVSYESSVDVDESYGVILKNCSVNEIKEAIRLISSYPTDKLKSMSKKAWEITGTIHSQANFSEEFNKVINHILEVHQNRNE